MKPLLDIKNVTGGYTKNPVLHNVSFSVNKGELIGLIGLNGAGKSTTIKHIIGLMDQKEGSIEINGNTLKENRETYKSQFTFIPETPILYEELTLEEHLRLTAMAYNIGEEEFKTRTAFLLKEFHMEKRLKWYPAHFSKGMKQKVMILCAFLVQPSLYIIDEPFVGLDPLGIQSLLKTSFNVKELPVSLSSLKEHPEAFKYGFLHIVHPVMESKNGHRFLSMLKHLFVEKAEVLEDELPLHLTHEEQAFLITHLIYCLHHCPKYLLLEYLFLPLCE